MKQERLHYQKYPYRQSVRAQNYVTGLIHLILCTVTGWAIHGTRFKETPYTSSAYMYMLAHSLLGILVYSHPDVSPLIEKLYNESMRLASTLPIGLLNAQKYLIINGSTRSIDISVAYTFIALAWIPLVWDAIVPRSGQQIRNGTVLLNIVALGWIAGNINEPYWTIGLIVLGTFNHFVLNRLSDRYNVPTVDFFTIGLIFLNIFSVNSLKEC